MSMIDIKKIFLLALFAPFVLRRYLFGVSLCIFDIPMRFRRCLINI